MSVVKKYSLDYATAKKDIIDHFKSIDRYSEYDFDQEGSALNLLMEILAYNTSQNAFIANRLASELLLETSQKRSTTTATANTLGGYLPKSAQASRTNIFVEILDLGDVSTIPDFITVESGKKFTASNGFEFFTTDNYIAYPDTDGFAVFDNIEIFEGKRVSFESSGKDNGFIISSNKADLTTLNIYVDGKRAQWLEVEVDIADATGDTLLYQIKENYDGQYVVTFGDGVIGKQLTSDNTISVDYIVSLNLDEANGLLEFTTDSIAGFSNIQVTATTRTHSGSKRESVESIKKYAPMHFSAANRAVNDNDYKYLIERNFSFVKAASVWGGEEGDNKNYGNTYVSIINQNNENITTDQKDRIKEFIQKYNIGPVTVNVQDFKVVEIYPIINITVDPKEIDYTTAGAQSVVQESINTYGETIGTFLKEYTSTSLVDQIQKDLAGVKQINVSNRINRVIEASSVSAATESIIKFEMPLYHPFDGYSKEKDGVIISTEIVDSKTGIRYYLNDDGYGNIRRYYNSDTGKKIYVNDKQGTINYSTGELRITPFIGFGDNEFTIRAQPSSNIIKSTRDTILRLTGKNAVIVIETSI